MLANKRTKPALAIAMYFMATVLNGCGQGEAPIAVEAEERYNPLLYSNVKTLTITSLVDSVTIKDIIPNKGAGECRFGGLLDPKGLKVPERTLKYGQSWRNIPITGCNKLLQVEVETNLGSWVFSW